MTRRTILDRLTELEKAYNPDTGGDGSKGIGVSIDFTPIPVGETGYFVVTLTIGYEKPLSRW